MPKGPNAADVFEPLWERLDANRRRYVVLVFVYIVAMTAFFTFLSYAVLAVPWILTRPDPMTGAPMGPDLVGDLFTWTGLGLVTGVTAILVLLYTLFALDRSETVILRRIGAERVGIGGLRETKRALHDMSVAAGLDHPPPLYVIDSSAANAMVVGRSPRTGVVAVTRGLAAHLTLDEERAVYAHLLSRLNARDTTWATVATVLMHPLWVWKRRYYDVVPFKEKPRRAAARKQRGPTTEEMQGDTCLLFPPYVIAVVAAHYLMAGQRHSHLYSTEFADAAGMILLKDPSAMVSALEKIVRLENNVDTCGGQYTQFFYAWTGEMSSNDESDPEFRRLVRIKQTLGAAAEGPS